jgi:hypothetical protein
MSNPYDRKSDKPRRLVVEESSSYDPHKPKLMCLGCQQHRPLLGGKMRGPKRNLFYCGECLQPKKEQP